MTSTPHLPGTIRRKASGLIAEVVTAVNALEMAHDFDANVDHERVSSWRIVDCSDLQPLRTLRFGPVSTSRACRRALYSRS
jgi:hypothetical protein